MKPKLLPTLVNDISLKKKNTNFRQHDGRKDLIGNVQPISGWIFCLSKIPSSSVYHNLGNQPWKIYKNWGFPFWYVPKKVLLRNHILILRWRVNITVFVSFFLPSTWWETMKPFVSYLCLKMCDSSGTKKCHGFSAQLVVPKGSFWPAIVVFSNCELAFEWILLNWFKTFFK